MSKAIYTPETTPRASEVETLLKDGNTPQIVAPAVVDSLVYSTPNALTDVKDYNDLYNNSIQLSVCYNKFLALAQDSFKSVDIAGQSSLYELEPLIESLIIAAEYAFKRCNKKIFRSESPLNHSSIDYRLKCVVESVVYYLNTHKDHTLNTSNNDILQLLIKLCQAKFNIMEPSLSKRVKQIYGVRKPSFCFR